MTTYDYIRANEQSLRDFQLISKTMLYYFEWYKKYLAVKKIEKKKTNAKKIVCNCGISYRQLCRAINAMENEC